MILQGAELKLVKDAFSTALHIVPPEGYHACGCGASFSPDYGL
jgi:Fe-S cluster assembly iron-binding protein IscA